MRMFKGQILVFLLIYMRNSSCVLDTFYDTGKEIWKLYSIIDEIKSHPDNDFNELNQIISHQLHEIHERLDRMEEFMESKIIHDSVKSLEDSAMLYKCIDTVEIFIQTIDVNYNEFRQQINKTDNYSDEFGKLLALIIPNIEDSIQLIRKKTCQRDELLPQHRNLVFAIAGHSVTQPSNICGNSWIMSKTLVRLFQMIIIAEIKVHVIFAISSIPQISKTTAWKRSFDRESFIAVIEIYVNIFSLSLAFTDIEYLRACEPVNNTWIRGESFYELENTFRTAIFHYNRQQCLGTSCYDIWFKESSKCEGDYYDDRTGCSGTLTECTHLNNIKACVLKSGRQRFHHVSSTEKGLLGNNSECPKDNSYIIESGIGLSYFHSTCACSCLGNDNKISVSIMQSNVNSNMVITGLRFIQQNGILYIQPREGYLHADGNINRYSEHWIHIPKNISESQTLPINREDSVFFLDDLRLSSGFVLTGVKFNRVKRKFETGFAIEIFGMPFNYKSGKLDLNPQYVASKKVSDEESGEPLIFEKISSALVALPLKLSPDNKKYVSLVQSNLNEDFGQSTLPLFDAVPVTTNPASPLGGFGIFHKGSDGYAGFISLRIYGIKYADYFQRFRIAYIQNV